MKTMVLERRARLRVVFTLLAASSLLFLRANAADDDIKRFPANAQPGLARAIRVEDKPLAHTAMMLAWDATGVIKGDARTQTLQALKNVDAALTEVGSSLERAVKVHFYLARDDDAAAVDAALAEVFGQRPIAAAWVTTTMADPAALVGVDVIAVASSPVGGGVLLANSPRLPKPIVGAHVAVLPAGRRIYFSGQAERDSDLAAATQKTMVGLGRSLDWLESGRNNIVQVKAFVRPFEEHRAAAEKIAEFFAGGPVPPCIFVEWSNPSSPAEIELIVAGGNSKERDPGGVAFLTPSGLTASPRFARIAVVDAGHPLIFISGLYGTTVGSGRREWQEIFTQLGDILWETGSSMRHQVKGTYYSTTAESRRLHGEIRDVYFDPARPPASSGMLTRGTGRPNRSSTIDMIAIPIPRIK